MALQTSGAITLSDVQEEFGGSNPISLSEYYGVASGVPTSGTITLADFYGTANIPTYRYIKWYVSSNKGNTLTQASEFRIRLNGSDISMSSATITDNQGNPSSEIPPNLGDGSTSTKWLAYAYPVSVIFDMGTATVFDGYRWATANDVSSRDPDDWQIYGSNDNSNWTLLHTVSNASVTDSRYTFVGPWTII